MVRLQKTGFMIGILLLVGLLITGVANAAPDMSQWEGKWFSYKVSMKGIGYDGSRFNKRSSIESGFFKIWDWDGENFQIDTYYLDNGVWQSASETLQFLAGNDMNFLFLLQNETDGVVFTALVQGKEKNGILSGANVTTYGGIIVEGNEQGNDFSVGSINLKGKMIDESKVKVTPNLWLH